MFLSAIFESFEVASSRKHSFHQPPEKMFTVPVRLKIKKKLLKNLA